MLPHIIMVRSIHNLRKYMREVLFQVHRLKLYANGEKGILNEKKNHRILKILVRMGRFIINLFLVIFQLSPSDFDSMFTISERLTVPNFPLYFFQVVS